MSNLKFNFENSNVTQKNIMEYKGIVENIHKELHGRSNKEVWKILRIEKYRFRYRTK